VLLVVDLAVVVLVGDITIAEEVTSECAAAGDEFIVCGVRGVEVALVTSAVVVG
jgi:hypothetical protein